MSKAAVFVVDRWKCVGLAVLIVETEAVYNVRRLLWWKLTEYYESSWGK